MTSVDWQRYSNPTKLSVYADVFKDFPTDRLAELETKLLADLKQERWASDGTGLRAEVARANVREFEKQLSAARRELAKRRSSNTERSSNPTSEEKVSAKIRVGDMLHVVVGRKGFVDAEVARIASRGLAKGETVTFLDGRRVSREAFPILREGTEGSEAYTWHSDGSRVRCELVEKTVHADGRLERRIVRQMWCDYLST